MLGDDKYRQTRMLVFDVTVECCAPLDPVITIDVRAMIRPS